VPSKTPILITATLTPHPTESLTEPVATASPSFTPTQAAKIEGQENFPVYTARSISLESGEVIVGTAVQFAARAYGCNTIDKTDNIPYTIFLIRGPIKVDIEINNGGWEHWVNVYDDGFVSNLLVPKRDEVRKYQNYLAVGHVECVISP
jgi:hypothetical protein